MNNHALPDLGALGQPQQVTLLPALLAKLGTPAELLDATALVALLREMVREEVAWGRYYNGNPDWAIDCVCGRAWDDHRHYRASGDQPVSVVCPDAPSLSARLDQQLIDLREAVGPSA